MGDKRSRRRSRRRPPRVDPPGATASPPHSHLVADAVRRQIDPYGRHPSSPWREVDVEGVVAEGPEVVVRFTSPRRPGCRFAASSGPLYEAEVGGAGVAGGQANRFLTSLEEMIDLDELPSDCPAEGYRWIR